MLSISEAGKRLVPLLIDPSELATLDELKRVFAWQPDRRGRNLVVWLIHEEILQPIARDGNPVRLQLGGDARNNFVLYRWIAGIYGKEHWGYDVIPDDDLYLNAEEFSWLLDFLSPAPTFFLDWQLAYRWAGLPMPSSKPWGLLQRAPEDFPRQVQQRLAWIRQFTSGCKSIPTPSSPPAGRSPLFADRWIGDLYLFSIVQFSAFFGRDGFPCESYARNLWM